MPQDYIRLADFEIGHAIQDVIVIHKIKGSIKLNSDFN